MARAQNVQATLLPRWLVRRLGATSLNRHLRPLPDCDAVVGPRGLTIKLAGNTPASVACSTAGCHIAQSSPASTARLRCGRWAARVDDKTRAYIPRPHIFAPGIDATGVRNKADRVRNCAQGSARLAISLDGHSPSPRSRASTKTKRIGVAVRTPKACLIGTTTGTPVGADTN
jgi:hypothetical protein